MSPAAWGHGAGPLVVPVPQAEPESNSADISKMWFVFRSIVSVLATGMVCQVLFYLEAGGAVFLNHRERAIALRAECFHRCGVEYGAIRASTNGQGGDDLAVVSIENHHRLGVAAGDEQNLALRIECQPGARATFADEIVRGTVKDSSGAVTPNATVTAISVDTGQVRTTIKGADGAYKFGCCRQATSR